MIIFLQNLLYALILASRINDKNINANSYLSLVKVWQNIQYVKINEN